MVQNIRALVYSSDKILTTVTPVISPLVATNLENIVGVNPQPVPGGQIALIPLNLALDDPAALYPLPTPARSI